MGNSITNSISFIDIGPFKYLPQVVPVLVTCVFQEIGPPHISFKLTGIEPPKTILYFILCLLDL